MYLLGHMTANFIAPQTGILEHMESPEIPFKSGFVAVAGRPNVGKSTLVNALMGQKIAAVSPRPQTTRKRQLGILSQEHAQVVFIDTPGLHKPVHKLGQAMNRQAQEALEDADLVLFLVEGNTSPTSEDLNVADRITSLDGASDKTLLIVNKIDLVPAETVPLRLIAYQALLPDAELFPLSALRGDNCTQLFQTILKRLPEGPVYYPEDQVTDLFEREIAADLIRSSALIHLRDEVPHGIVVRVDEFTERGEAGAYIAATVFVERESHKSIVIGQSGKMIKQIGSTARLEIEAMSGRKIFLELRVKVREGWRDDEKALRQLGYEKAE